MELQIDETTIARYRPLAHTRIIFCVAVFVAMFPAVLGEGVLAFFLVFFLMVFIGGCSYHKLSPWQFCHHYITRNVRGYQYVVGKNPDSEGEDMVACITACRWPLEEHRSYLPVDDAVGMTAPRVTGIGLPLGGWWPEPKLYSGGHAFLNWKLRESTAWKVGRPAANLDLLWERGGGNLDFVLRCCRTELIIEFIPFLSMEFRSPEDVFWYALKNLQEKQ